MYQPKSVLITGVAGFIPSNLACHLVNKYPDVLFVGIDKMSYCSDKRNIEEIMTMPNFTFIEANICDKDKMEELWVKYLFDTVIHMAAYSHVDYSFVQPLKFTINNTLGTHVLLEVARAKGIKRFIHVSTDEVYGSQGKLNTEQSKIQPTNPYSASKAAAEVMVNTYMTCYNFPAIITRGNNVYGPKQYPEKVIPRFILRTLKGQKCQIQGSGNQARSFLYTDDVSNAFDLIVHYGQLGQIYNIGTEEEYTINQLATKIVEKLGAEIEHVPDRIFNDTGYRIDYSKLAALGWKQTISLDDGLDLTIAWYQKHADWYCGSAHESL